MALDRRNLLVIMDEDEEEDEDDMDLSEEEEEKPESPETLEMRRRRKMSLMKKTLSGYASILRNCGRIARGLLMQEHRKGFEVLLLKVQNATTDGKYEWFYNRKVLLDLDWMKMEQKVTDHFKKLFFIEHAFLNKLHRYMNLVVGVKPNKRRWSLGRYKEEGLKALSGNIPELELSFREMQKGLQKAVEAAKQAREELQDSARLPELRQFMVLQMKREKDELKKQQEPLLRQFLKGMNDKRQQTVQMAIQLRRENNPNTESHPFVEGFRKVVDMLTL